MKKELLGTRQMARIKAKMKQDAKLKELNDKGDAQLDIILGSEEWHLFQAILRFTKENEFEACLLFDAIRNRANVPLGDTAVECLQALGYITRRDK